LTHTSIDSGGPLRQFLTRQPENPYEWSLKWDGEWQVTYDTFRDMGIAYSAGLVLIYLLVVAQFRSYGVPLIIMAPIPLTLIGILPGHAPMCTVLEFGLARFRAAGGEWQFIAAPGAVLRLAGQELHFSTRRYLRDADFERVRVALREQLLAEENALRDIRNGLRRLEEEMLKRLWKLGRAGEAPL